MVICTWLVCIWYGDCMELVEVLEELLLWLCVIFMLENCLGVECVFYDDCYVVKVWCEV